MGNETSASATTSTMVSDDAVIKVAKILIVGSRGVGKTSLVQRCVQHRVEGKAISQANRLDVSLVSIRQASGAVLQLHLWDVPSSESSSGRTPILYANAQRVVIVVDACNLASFGTTRGEGGRSDAVLTFPFHR